jgi:hypothetical protein
VSVIKITQALFDNLSNVVPEIKTAWQNTDFTAPSASVAYQVPTILFSQPDDQEFGARHTQTGVLKIKLYYPSGQGSAPMLEQAELIRHQFKKSTSLVSDDLVVNIHKTPEIAEIEPEDGRFVGVVTIYFISHIEG